MAEGEIAETLLVNAVDWVLKWRYKDVTDLLGGLVRVLKELVTRFNNAFDGLPGSLTISKGLILNEEGYAKDGAARKCHVNPCSSSNMR